MKGMALETIGFITIALIGVSVLIILVSGSLGSMSRNVFCYFYQNVFGKNIEMCEEKGNIPETLEIKPKDSEELARYIAAYSIKCWEDATKSLNTEDTNCFNLIIETGPFDPGVDEISVTDILLAEGGCSKLGNYNLNDNCGTEDQLRWEISSGGYSLWENRGPDAAWTDNSGVLHIVNGNWVWENSGSWSGPIEISTLSPFNSLTVSGNEYYPWENGGIDAAWMNNVDKISISNGGWIWTWTPSNGWNGPINFYERPYWGDENHATYGLEPSPDGYLWSGYGLDVGWLTSNNRYAMNEKWLWFFDPNDNSCGRSRCWRGPYDVLNYVNVGEYNWGSSHGMSPSADGYPWENGGIDAAWTDNSGITYITNGKWQWYYSPNDNSCGEIGCWSSPEDISSLPLIETDYCIGSKCPITDQQLILIKYDDIEKQIVVKG
ncbi:MAG: hypothetical protein GF368_00465 [Candidatus Aenigmarchaeota archaeon]|nr:hypothetical protein [Candidatus Aenigmarchaeota archaeon]